MPELECPGLKPMAEWIKEELDGECRPCALAALVGEYEKELDTAGVKSELSAILGNSGDDPVLAVAQEMDRLKESGSDELKNRLLALDCMAQNYGKED